MQLVGSKQNFLFSAVCRGKASNPAMCSVIPSAGKFSKLPEIARPSRYAITLAPDLQKFIFDGQETVDIEVFLQYIQVSAEYLFRGNFGGREANDGERAGPDGCVKI